MIKHNGRKRGANPNKLAANQLLFADEYISNGLRGTEAARSVGYKNPGVMAAKMLKYNVDIRAYIEKKLTEISAEKSFRKYELLAKMERLSKFNLMKSAVSSRGGKLEISVKRWEEVADEIGDCVTEIESEIIEGKEGYTRSVVRIKLMSKDRMHELEMKYFGLLTDKYEINQRMAIDWDKTLQPVDRETEVAAMEDIIEGEVVKRDG